MADSPFSPEDSFISIVYFCGAVLCNLLIFFSRTTHVGSHHPWLLAQHICFSFHVQIAAKSCKFELFDNTELTIILFHQYGKDYEYDAPVKLLDKHLHAMAQSPDEQLVVVSQVSSSFCTNLCFYVINEMANLSCFYLELGIYYFIIWQFFEKKMMNFQVLVADINIGYEEIVNIQVTMITTESIFMVWDLFSQVIIYTPYQKRVFFNWPYQLHYTGSYFEWCWSELVVSNCCYIY